MGWYGRTNRQEDSLDSAILLKALDDPFDLFNILYTVPEQAPSGPGEASVCSLKVPGPVLVIRLRGPEQPLVVLLDGVEDVVHNLVQDTISRWQELGHDRGFTFRVRNNGDDVKRLITVDGVRSLLESAEDFGYASLASLNFWVPLGEYVAELGRTDGVNGGLLVQLVTSTNQSSGTGIGEQLLLKHVSGDDCDRRCSGQAVEQFLDFSELELGSVLDPRFPHQAVVFLRLCIFVRDAYGERQRFTYLIQVDGVQLLAGDTVEETAFLVQVDNLHRLFRKDDESGTKLGLTEETYLEYSGEFSGGNISVDIQHLTVLGLRQTGQDRQTSGSDGSLDRSLVDRCDLSNETVLFLVQVGGSEDARRNGSGSCAETFEGGSKLEVFLQEDSLKEGCLVRWDKAEIIDFKLTRAICKVLASVIRIPSE